MIDASPNRSRYELARRARDYVVGTAVLGAFDFAMGIGHCSRHHTVALFSPEWWLFSPEWWVGFAFIWLVLAVIFAVWAFFIYRY